MGREEKNRLIAHLTDYSGSETRDYIWRNSCQQRSRSLRNQIEIECVGIENYFGISLPSISGVFFDQPDTRITKFEYNDSTHPQDVTKTIDAYGNYTQTTYNPDGTLSQTRDKRGGITKYTYDTDFPVPKITCVEDPMGFKRWTNYVKTPGAAYGKILSTVDARGSGPDDTAHMTSYEYDEKGNQTAVTDPMGNTTRYIYDNSGKMIESIDPNGYHSYYSNNDTEPTYDSSMEKDALGRIRKIQYGDGKIVTYDYDNEDNLTKTTWYENEVSPESKLVELTSEYDVLGRLISSSDFDGRSSRYEYDAMGRKTKETQPDNKATAYEYDAKGKIRKVTYHDNTYTEVEYDIYGNLSKTKQRSGKITQYTYDRLNRVKSIKDPEGGYTYFDYDPNGNRIAIRDSRSSGPDDNTYRISYTYDANNRPYRIDYPDGTYETIGYDPNGNIISHRDPKGQVTEYIYDNANRLIKNIYPDQSTAEIRYDNVREVLEVKEPDNSTITYENLGLIKREKKLDSNQNLVYDYYWVHDELGRFVRFMDATEATISKYSIVRYNEYLNKIGYTSSATLGHHFKYGKNTSDNRLYHQGEPDSRVAWGKIKFGTGGIQYASAPGVLTTTYNYDEYGNYTSMTDPFGKTFRFENTERYSRVYYPNNTFLERAMNLDGELSEISHKRTEADGTTTVLESFSYQYDINGNFSRITLSNGEYTDYTYDLLDRLTCEEKKTQAGQRIYKIEYLFDNNDAKNGNIHRIVVNDTDVTEFTYNPMNQLTGITHPDSSTETLTYDDNGNLTQSVNNTTGITTTYTWDCNNRMTGVVLSNGEILEFGYQGDKMIIKEKSDGREKTITNSGLYGIRETIKVGGKAAKRSVAHTVLSNPSSMGDLSGQILSSRMFSPEGVYGSDSGDIYYHPDHLGSVRLITDENGNIKDRLQTDAYGNTLPLETAQSGKPAKTLQPFNFIGSYGIRYLHKIKMYNMRARWQNSQTTRFISTDEIFSTNRYNYVAGNPVMMVDPMGEHGILFNTEKNSKTVIHSHKDKYSYLVPRYLVELKKKDTYTKLVEQFKSDGILTEKLLNMNEEAKSNNLKFYKTFKDKVYKTKIVQERKEFTTNCAGYAFSGMKGVDIRNSAPTAVNELLAYHYVQIGNAKKVNQLKRGDVLLEKVDWDEGRVKNFNHVRTIAVMIRNRKNGCINAVTDEVDGYYPFVMSLFENENLSSDITVFRPRASTILYLFGWGDYEYTQPYKKVVKSDSFYSNNLSQDSFFLDMNNWTIES